MAGDVSRNSQGYFRCNRVVGARSDRIVRATLRLLKLPSLFSRPPVAHAPSWHAEVSPWASRGVAAMAVAAWWPRPMEGQEQGGVEGW